MPTGGCARLAVGMWLLIALILGTVYRSNLKALLIIPKLELPFDSMEDLIKSGITTAVLDGTSVHRDVMDSEKEHSTMSLYRLATILGRSGLQSRDSSISYFNVLGSTPWSFKNEAEACTNL
ncbi:hypothetical protein O3P69_014907 [Scylla paramamosain]|uniref:Ionotropic glutamate receptor C-terminal domain-containing protein n=1 Tax=Scylla paramamosain TaxID=85552 RepID=A0AAW0U1M7_SCYPA